jgi:hypothetical protein
MELLGDKAQVETHFVLFGVVLVLTRSRVAPNLPYARKSVSTHPMELLGGVSHVKSCFSLFGDSVSVGAR